MMNDIKDILAIKPAAIAISMGLAATSGCTDETELLVQTGDIQPNQGIVSHKNFNVLASDLNPNVYNVADGSFDSKTVDISVIVGDRNNLLLTDSHTVFFVTDYGLIEPSCVTENGTCSVEWTADKIPVGLAGAADGRATITAYTIGEEGFTDTNGNGLMDSGETYLDIGEPIINFNGDQDANQVAIWTPGVDIPIDTVNLLDPTGSNGDYDGPDGFFNGAGCTDTPRCSSQTTIFIHADVRLGITVAAYSVTAAITGLPGGDPVTISLNGGTGQDINVDDPSFTFPTLVEDGQTYTVTIGNQPNSVTCTVGNGNGTISGGNVSNVTINCT